MMTLEHVDDPDSCREYIFGLFVRFSARDINFVQLEQGALEAIERAIEKAEEKAVADASAEAEAGDPFPELVAKYGRP